MVEWIDTDAALIELVDHLVEQDWITVDTEFHRERTYYAQLGLVQVASRERIACIDPLAIEDLEPLDDLMLDDRILKVVHSGRQDLEIFFHRTGEVPGPIFDSQVAASLLGMGDQIGYAALVSQVKGVNLGKMHGRTDWMRRPLDEAVIEYAACDVSHLRDVYLALDNSLKKRGRRAWLDEEQATLVSPTTYSPAEDDLWHRVSGSGRLKGVDRAVARALAIWRERRAQEVDRPRKRVLSDEVIVALARQQPKSVQVMERMRALDPGIRKRHGAALIAVIERAARSPKKSWPKTSDRGRPDAVDAALVDALSSVLKNRARKVNVSARLLASRSDLENIARGERDVPVLRGWRNQLVGDVLTAFVEGRIGLEVWKGELLLVTIEDD